MYGIRVMGNEKIIDNESYTMLIGNNWAMSVLPSRSVSFEIMPLDQVNGMVSIEDLEAQMAFERENPELY